MWPALAVCGAHDAKQKRAVGRKNRRRAETIVDRRLPGLPQWRQAAKLA